MEDPVIASDGYSYERRCITEWFSQGKHDSPVTKARLSNLNLSPNMTLKQVIGEWMMMKTVARAGQEARAAAKVTARTAAAATAAAAAAAAVAPASAGAGAAALPPKPETLTAKELLEAARRKRRNEKSHARQKAKQIKQRAQAEPQSPPAPVKNET